MSGVVVAVHQLSIGLGRAGRGLVGGLGLADGVHVAGGTIVRVTNDRTMSQYVHHTAQSRAEFSVDEATTPKQITMNITGHPNPAKVIEIPEDLPAVFVNLALHRTDLSRARAFLDEFDRQGGVEPGQWMSTVCKGLWHAALGSTRSNAFSTARPVPSSTPIGFLELM